MRPILVQFSDRHWTTQALHLACALARSNQTEIVLLRLNQVPHLSYLGSEFGDVPLTNREYDLVHQYASTAEDYGVPFALSSMQCISILDAMADAAEHIDAEVIFANVPEVKVRLWRNFQLWMLNKRFSKAHRTLYTLASQSRKGNNLSSITVKHAH